MKQEWVLLRQWMVGCEVHWPEEWRGRKQAVAGVTQFKDILLHCFKITMSGETLSETIATLNLDNNLWNFPVPAMPGKKNGQWPLWRLQSCVVESFDLSVNCIQSEERKKVLTGRKWSVFKFNQKVIVIYGSPPFVTDWCVCKIQPFYSCFWCFF